MNYLYTINLYNKDKKIHSEQLISVGNYSGLNKLLNSEKDIKPGEYVIDNGKMLITVINNILMEKYLKVEPQTINVKNSNGNNVVKIHHPLTNLSTSFMCFVFEAQAQNELEEDGNILIFSQAVHKLYTTHDLFTNVILSDLFATTDAIDEFTGEVREGFKLTIGVQEDE